MGRGSRYRLQQRAVEFRWFIATFFNCDAPKGVPGGEGVDWSNYRNWTMADVKDKFIVPATREQKCAYVDVITEHGVVNGESGGQLDFFISHSWKNKFQDTLSQLKAEVERRLKSRTSWVRGTIYIWLDIFAVNQHPGEAQGEDLSNLPWVIGWAFYGVILVIDPGAQVLTRAWCLTELFYISYFIGRQAQTIKIMNRNTCGLFGVIRWCVRETGFCCGACCLLLCSPLWCCFETQERRLATNTPHLRIKKSEVPQVGSTAATLASNEEINIAGNMSKLYVAGIECLTSDMIDALDVETCQATVDKDRTDILGMMRRWDPQFMDLGELQGTAAVNEYLKRVLHRYKEKHDK